MVEDIAAAHPEVRIDLEIREWTDAAEARRTAGSRGSARAAVAAETGARPPTSVSPASPTPAITSTAPIPAVILGPGSLGVAHTADEWVAVEDLVTATRACARLFVGFLGS